MQALLHDRVDAGRRLAAAVDAAGPEDAVVVGLARGGVPVAAEVARRLAVPLDALAVRKIGHPWQPEYALGAAAPGGDGVFVRSHGGLDDHALRHAIGQAKAKAERLDHTLHEHRPPVELGGRTAVLVDDGLATGATMMAAVRWARGRGAAWVLVAVPVGAAQSLRALREEADQVVCPYEIEDFVAVGLWYDVFTQVDDAEVVALLDELASPAPAA